MVEYPEDQIEKKIQSYQENMLAKNNLEKEELTKENLKQSFQYLNVFNSLFTSKIITDEELRAYV